MWKDCNFTIGSIDVIDHTRKYWLTIDIMSKSNTFTALDIITISEGPVHWSTSIGKLQLDTFQKTLLLWYILLWLTLQDIGLKFPQIEADVEFLRRKDCTFPPWSVFRSKQFVCVPSWSNGRHQTDNRPTYHRLNQGLNQEPGWRRRSTG